MRDDLVTMCLAGDVMTGRGVDQILPHPGDSRLWEPYVADARSLVELAERAQGPIPRPVDVAWPWGEALELVDEMAPTARLINLETSVTRSDAPASGKAVHYRMNPDNVGCLAAARPDACALANNHVLDFGLDGLEETLEALAAVGTRPVGAGRDVAEAAEPAAVPFGDDRRVWILSFGARSSGIPMSWAATRNSPGIAILPDLSHDTAAAITDRVRSVRKPGDVVVASLHWGTNWGYHVPAEHVRFAHQLVDGGVDIVHGHSSHHPRPIEVYRGRLILYGCGDFLDDYEGIGGHERYRHDLRLLYFPSLAPDTGDLVQLRMAAMRPRRMRLRRASNEDCQSVLEIFNRINHRFGTRTEMDTTGLLNLRQAR